MITDENIARISDKLYDSVRPVGSGYYAQVYLRPRSNTVVKIAHDDDAYNSYLDMIDAHLEGNPHVPEILCKHITKEYTYVVMERLVALPELDSDEYELHELTDGWDRISATVEHCLKKLRDPANYTSLGFCAQWSSNFDQVVQDAISYVRRWLRSQDWELPIVSDSFIETLVTIIHMNAEHKWCDLHDANFMVRVTPDESGMTLVVTDPFS